MVNGLKGSALNDDLTNLTLTIGDIRITPLSIQIEKVYPTIIGCEMNPAVLEVEGQKYIYTPLVEFTQNLNYRPFSQS